MAGIIGTHDISASASSLNIIPENYKIALFLIKKAAGKNLPEALARLGHIYESGGYEDEKTGKFYPLLKKNIDKALPFFQKATDFGNENAINFLGAYYFNIKKEI